MSLSSTVYFSYFVCITAQVMRREEGVLERTEMRMLQWIPGVSLKDKKRN